MGGKSEHSTAQVTLLRVSLGQNQSISRAMLLFAGSGKNLLPNSFKWSEFISLRIEGRGPCVIAGCGSLSCSLGPLVFFAALSLPLPRQQHQVQYSKSTSLGNLFHLVSLTTTKESSLHLRAQVISLNLLNNPGKSPSYTL